jgi:hypothetical protein
MKPLGKRQILLGLVGATTILSCLASPLRVLAQPGSESAQNQDLVIETESPLPDTYPGESYTVYFHARGGVPPLHWRTEPSMWPLGVKLEDNGVLHGVGDRPGEYHITVVVTDSDTPPRSIKKSFVIHVSSALALKWKTEARVNGNRIEGSAVITNTTRDDVDLTFIVLAVAENGRATAIGYQHFLLPHGTIEKELPFGDTLPHGGYVVHVDAVGEVEKRNLIYRERLQTPRPLQVTVGP